MVTMLPKEKKLKKRQPVKMNLTKLTVQSQVKKLLVRMAAIESENLLPLATHTYSVANTKLKLFSELI